MNISQSSEWLHLNQLSQSLKTQSISKFFQEDPSRFENFSTQVGDILFDYSKQNITPEVINALYKLCHAAGLEKKIHALFSGEVVNYSENRPALHMALRDRTSQKWLYENQDIKPDILSTFDKIDSFVQAVHSGDFKGVTGQSVTDVISLGIGGSDLGPVLACEALKPYHQQVRVHFVSNLDADTLEPLLKRLEASKTLCIINSKTFTTIETIENAKQVLSWLEGSLGKDAIKQCVAVTANLEKAKEFGFQQEQIFPFWDWVGGRYSLWSSVGLSVALQVGMKHFNDLLNGANIVDQHFQTTPLKDNVPVIMAMIGIWNINFQGSETLAIMPYADGLFELPNYLQQLEMESNGKSAKAQGGFVPYQTAPVIWGGVGCNGQHAYMQMLHQGPSVIPVDFIVPIKSRQSAQPSQSILVANALAQSKALMEGRAFDELQQDHLNQGMSEDAANSLAEARVCPGSRPSTTMMFSELTPNTLGQLIALYEHKVFVQSVIWQINAFDQWGVELGKQLAKSILPVMDSQAENQLDSLDPSTKGLIQRFQAG